MYMYLLCSVVVKRLSGNRPQERWENIPAEERLQEEPPPRHSRSLGAGGVGAAEKLTDRNEIATTTSRITGNARENRGHKAHGPSRINVGGKGGDTDRLQADRA